MTINPANITISKAPLESGSEGKSSQFVLLCRVLCGQMHYTDQMSDGTATATAKQVGQYHMNERSPDCGQIKTKALFV